MTESRQKKGGGKRIVGGGSKNVLDAAFLLTVGSFLLTVELFYLQSIIVASILTVGALLLTVLAFFLQLEHFCLQWESASNKGLRDCKQRSLTVSKKAPTVSKKTSPKTFLGRGFSPNLRYVFHPPEFSTPLGRSQEGSGSEGHSSWNLTWGAKH